MHPPEDLLDLMYDAATEDALWSKALTRVADLTGSLGGLMFVLDIREHAVPIYYNGRMSDDALRAYEDRHFVNPWSEHMHASPTGHMVQSEDIVPLPVLKRSAFYNECLRPQGMTHNFMVPLTTRPDFQIGFNLCRSEKQGRLPEDGVQLFTRLYPHIKRSVLLGFRLGGYRALQSAAFGVMDRLLAAFILLDSRGSVLFANTAATDMARPDGAFRLHRAGVAITSPPHAQKFDLLLQRALAGSPVGIMSIPHPADGRLLTLLVSPIRSGDFDRFQDIGIRDAAVLLHITDPLISTGVPFEWLRDAYGLTQAEARVALGASTGASIPQIAARLGLSTNTIKTHLRKVFAKVGITRQSELARLVASLGVVKPNQRD